MRRNYAASTKCSNPTSSPRSLPDRVFEHYAITARHSTATNIGCLSNVLSRPSSRSEPECDVGPDRPATEVAAPEIRSTDADPLRLPELVQKVQHKAPMDL